MRRRTLLLSSAASIVPSWAGAQCVTDTVAVDACRGGVYLGGGTPSLNLDFTTGTLDPRIVFTRAAGPATYFDAAGVLQTAGTNVPRFDYDPVTHAARGLLIEEARTNLLLNSATLGTQSVAVTAQAYTLSFYGTGTVTLSGTSTAGPLVGTGAFPQRVALTFTPTAGTLTCTVSGSVLNANLEAGSFATSYIPTTSAAATRAAEQGSIASINSAAWFNAVTGTIAADYAVPYASLSTGNPVAVELDDGTTNNTETIRLGSVNQAISLVMLASVLQGGSNVNGGWVGNAAPNKSAITYNTAGATTLMSNNGAAASSSAVPAWPSGINRLLIGSGRGTNLSGWISRIRYWPRAMSASELQQVTT